ncbi:MAG: iron-sulfur cluster repair di-iron protein [Bacteroidales bacterium]
MKNYREMSVGHIVADDFSNASIFEKYNIDFCCNGADSLELACLKSGADIDKVVVELSSTTQVEAEGVNFKDWSLDLLCDYILKYHHRNIRTEGIKIANLLDKVCNAHSSHHPELLEVREIFTASLEDLYSHLEKEEVMLFPHIYKMYNSQVDGLPVPEFHCGSVSAPISVMMQEHQTEGDRYFRIADITNNYEIPSDGCSSYELLMRSLKKFNLDLHQHIHLENNILFPLVVEIENGVR